MNKKEFIEAVAERSIDYKTTAEKNINIILDVIIETLEKGEDVKIGGFGTFTVRERKKRIGRNPHDPSQTYEIPASKTPFFIPSKKFKEVVNKGKKEGEQ